jgi:hypothetical protein
MFQDSMLLTASMRGKKHSKYKIGDSQYRK